MLKMKGCGMGFLEHILTRNCLNNNSGLSLWQFWHITFNDFSVSFSRKSSGVAIPFIKINYASNNLGSKPLLNFFSLITFDEAVESFRRLLSVLEAAK